MARRTYKPGGLTNRLVATNLSIQGAAHRAIDRAAQDTVAKFNEVVNRWTNRPVFRVKTAAGIVRLIVVTGDEKAVRIWGYVDKGTEPHVILPKRGGFLAFRTGYSPRTAPIANFNVGTGSAKGSTVYTRQGVLHPGTEAREFSGYFGLEALDLMQDYMRQERRKL